MNITATWFPHCTSYARTPGSNDSSSNLFPCNSWHHNHSFWAGASFFFWDKIVQFGKMVRLCNALVVHVFQAACVYSADLCRQRSDLSDQLHWCQGLFDNTNSCTKNTHTVTGETLTALWKHMGCFKTRLIWCGGSTQSKMHMFPPPFPTPCFQWMRRGFENSL